MNDLKTMKISKKIMVSMVVVLSLIQVSLAQNNSQYRIIRSNIGSSGSSHTVSTSRGTYHLSQSIGQSSVIGTHFNSGYYLRQGYQQPDTKARLINNSDVNLHATIYPNPFSQGLFISLSEEMRTDIFIMVFDVNGRVIYNQKFAPTQKIELQLGDISSGSYFLKVTSENKYFNTKLIKI